MDESGPVDEAVRPGGAAAGDGGGEGVDTPKENGCWPPAEPAGRTGARYPSAAALWSTTYPPPSRWDWGADPASSAAGASTLLAAAPAAPDDPVLPHRVPVDAEPAPSRVPASSRAPAPPAQTPELARIATHLRRDDEPGTPRERPEGFDVDAVLGAAHDVSGVRGASLRTTPSGAHLLRLDLADGADAAHVSREVARMLQERLGLAAGPASAARIPQQAEPARRAAHAAGDPPRPSRRGRRRAPDDSASWGPPPTARPPRPRTPAAAPRDPDPHVAGPHEADSAAIVPRDPAAQPAPAPAPGAGDPGPAQSPSPPTARAAGAIPVERPGVGPARLALAPSGPEAPPGGTVDLAGPALAAAAPILAGSPLVAPPASARVRIGHVGTALDGLDATVEVRLVAGDRTASGTASGPAVERYLPRLCAAAAAAAIGDLVGAAGGRQGRCFVEQAAVVPLGACDVAVVVVLLVCDGWVEQLAGAAIVTDDAHQATVRATMAAVNRLLDALL